MPTHYEVDGNTLTQIVDHQGGGFAYPIVADPTYTFPRSNSLYSRIVEDRNSSTGEVIIRVYVNQNVTGWQRIPRSTLVDNYNAIVSSTYERQNLRPGTSKLGPPGTSRRALSSRREPSA